jgi:bleomycin hydrolase
MGNSQSTSKLNEPAAEKMIIERLEALRLRDRLHSKSIDDEYIHIDSEKGRPIQYSTDPSLDIATTTSWEKELLADPKNRLALNALLSNNLNSIAMNKVSTLADTQTFNVKIPFEGAPVTNQRSSGRCWLFATTNVLRVPVMKRYNLADFELSQAYLFFWDKMEKANWFLEQIIDTASKDLDDRLIQELLSAPENDGGQWDMAANLVEKYGLVPQKLYPDSYNAMNSSAMGHLITTKLREDALVLRSMVNHAKTNKSKSSDIILTKAKFLREIHCILTLMLGPPPKPDEKFTWEYLDKDGKFHGLNLTPLEFAKQGLCSPATVRAMSGVDVTKMFSLVNDPRNAYMTHLTVSRLGNVVGGHPIRYVNVDMSTMKKSAIAMLKAGIPVFFGSDVGKYSNTQSGIMDVELFDYELTFNISLSLSKSQRLKVRESAMTHAMVLTAVHLEKNSKGEETAMRWRVMNSWGATAGEGGYFVMTDKWMDEFVYQVVVDPGFVSKEVRSVLDKEATVLPLWDPMGALA